MTIAQRALDLITGRPAAPEHPVEIQGSELEDLGSVKGTRYWKHAKWGVLREHQVVVGDHGDLPNLPFVTSWQGDERVMTVYAIVSADAWRRITAPRPESAASAMRAVDALRSAATFRARREVGLRGDGPVSTSPFVGAPRPWTVEGGSTNSAFVPGGSRAVTPAEKRERFEKKGLRLEPVSRDDDRLIAYAPAGRMIAYVLDDLRESIELIRPLVAHGTDPVCEKCQSETATIVSEPDGVLLGVACMDGAA